VSRAGNAHTMTDSSVIAGETDRILKLQHELSRILADVVDPLAGLQEALDRVVTLPGVDGVWTWFRDDIDGDFSLHHTAGLTDPLTWELDSFPADSPVARRLNARQESVGTWEEIWPAKAQLIHRMGWTRVAVLPIISQGQIVGALGGGRKSTESLSEPCLWILRTLANATGSLLASVRHESRYRNTSENLARLLDSFSDRMFIVAPDGRILYHNLAAVNSGRPDRLDIVGRKMTDVLPGYDHLLCSIRDVGSRVAEDQLTLPRQAHLIDGAGTKLPVEVRVDKGMWDGAPADIVVCRDISGHLDLARKNERLFTAINSVTESIVITDRDGRIQYVNPAFCRCVGYTAEEVIGENPRILKSGEHDGAFYEEMWATLNRGAVWTGRIVNRRRDGELFTEEATLSPVQDAGGVITHFVGVKRDVTAEIQMEEQLRERQKMEAVGTLAGGIAHDFNNILYALLGYVDLALDDIPEDHAARPALTEVVAAGNRAAGLVAKMLTFGRRSDGRRESVKLADVVGEGLELVRASLPTTVRIETEMISPDCRVMADVPQLHQVILNLCQNAWQAMSDGVGELRITVEQLELDAKTARKLGGLKPGSWACVKVIDTGCGIDSAVLDRIFEPYFTTRPGKAGHGLGLATVHGIVASHRGRVLVDSRLGSGSEFGIYLPAQAVTPEVDAPPAGRIGPIAGHGRIMVIDDEPMVADVLERALTRFGFETRVFGNGVEALEVFRASPYEFDVVITDQSMPNITGFELASQMLAIRPELPLVLTTGYSEKANQELAREAGIRCFLPKPLKIRELGEILMEMTDPQPVSQ